MDFFQRREALSRRQIAVYIIYYALSYVPSAWRFGSQTFRLRKMCYCGIK